jgi:hypothetical protein
VSTVIIVSGVQHLDELKHAIHQPFSDQYRRIKNGAGQLAEAKKNLRAMRFFCGHYPEEIIAGYRMSSQHWTSPFFLIVHSTEGVGMVKKISAELGQQQIFDAVIISPSSDTCASVERKPNGILFAAGSFLDSVIKQAVVDALMHFADGERFPFLQLDLPSVRPPPPFAEYPLSVEA